MMMLVGQIIETVKASPTFPLSDEQLTSYFSLICLNYAPKNRDNFFATNDLLERFVNPKNYGRITTELKRNVEAGVRYYK